MTPVAVIQARMSSRRLPGKILMEVAGKPLLAYLVERLRHSRRLQSMIVATSQAPEDDPVIGLCEQLGIRSFRGALEDVLGRLLAAAGLADASAIVRVNGDSPLLDQALVDRGVAEFDAGDADIVTNVFPRSFPKGQSVEVISVAALARVAGQTSDPDDREHVTRFFYNHPERFKIRNFACKTDLSGVQMSVDTPEDLEMFKSTIARLKRPHWEYGFEEILLVRG
jgi:spore coat polysaccharide biosynthesis protein SpsF